MLSGAGQGSDRKPGATSWLRLVRETPERWPGPHRRPSCWSDPFLPLWQLVLAEGYVLIVLPGQVITTLISVLGCEGRVCTWCYCWASPQWQLQDGGVVRVKVGGWAHVWERKGGQSRVTVISSPSPPFIFNLFLQRWGKKDLEVEKIIAVWIFLWVREMCRKSLCCRKLPSLVQLVLWNIKM